MENRLSGSWRDTSRQFPPNSVPPRLNTEKCSLSFKAITKVIPLVSLISSCLSRRISEKPEWKASSAVVYLFRDFWFYSTVFGLSDSSLGWQTKLQKDVQNIARYSPILTFEENEPMKQTLEMNSALKGTQATSKDVEELRQGLISAIGAGNPKDLADLERNISTMNYPFLIYHLAVLRLERLRLSALVTSAVNDYDYANMFFYVENQMVNRSKGVRDQVLKEICLTIYRTVDQITLKW